MPADDARSRYTVGASALLGLLAHAKARKVDVRGALGAAGLTDASLEGPEARVPQTASDLVWERVVEASNDRDFGLHFAERIEAEAFGVVGHLLTRSRTLGEGLERAVAYSRLLHDAGRLELERSGDRLTIYPGCRDLPYECPRHVAEFSTASVLVLGRAITGQPLVPRSVSFRHPRPSSVREHVRLLGVEPEFGARETFVVLDAKVLELPTATPELHVLTYLDAYARDVLAKLSPEDDYLGRVERVIARELTVGTLGVERVAAQLGVSVRTLQRRLADDETSFQALVDGVRRRFAERYLSDDRLAVSEVAFLTGFADPSNFHRAFRRWTGLTPAAYRQRHPPEGGAPG